MNLNDAVNNLNQVLFVGRIEMPNGPLSAQEHQELAGNFNLLVARAQLADKLEEKIKGLEEEVNKLHTKELDKLQEEVDEVHERVSNIEDVEPEDIPEVPEDESINVDSPANVEVN
jgi:hypothetical protein